MKQEKKTIPDPYRRFDKIVLGIISTYWGLLLLFGIFTLIQPDWLKNISKPGRTEEADAAIKSGNILMYQAAKNNDKIMMQQAADNYLTALAIDSLNTAAISNLSVTYMYLGYYRESKNLLDKLQRLDTAFNYFIYSTLGDMYDRMGKSGEALNYYLRSAKDHDDPSYILRKAGLYLTKAGKYEEAVSYLNRSITMGLSFEYYYSHALREAYHHALFTHDTVNIDFLKKELARNSFTDEIKKYDEVIYRSTHRINKDLGYAYMYLGDVYSELLWTAKAEECYRASVEYYPGFSGVIANKQSAKQGMMKVQ